MLPVFIVCYGIAKCIERNKFETQFFATIGSHKNVEPIPLPAAEIIGGLLIMGQKRARNRDEHGAQTVTKCI